MHLIKQSTNQYQFAYLRLYIFYKVSQYLILISIIYINVHIVIIWLSKIYQSVQSSTVSFF